MNLRTQNRHALALAYVLVHVHPPRVPKGGKNSAYFTDHWHAIDTRVAASFVRSGGGTEEQRAQRAY